MAKTTTAVLQTSEQRALAALLTRRGLFRVLGWVMQTSLSPVARGTAPFDEQRVALAAVRVQQLSLLIPEVFRTDTRFANFTSVQTAATPSLWTQQQDFDGKADALTAAADALADAAADHDREAAVDAIRQIATACNACHSAYTHTK
jgi:cytochrome c556